MGRVFITGIAGFLGSYIADRFIEEGWSVSGCDNLIGGYRDNVPRDAEFHEIDCLNLDELTAEMGEVDIVYHTACTAYEGLSVFTPSLVVANTFQISTNAMVAAIKNGCSRFVHCSSMARYGTQDTIPFREEMVCKPQDPYGIAKYSAELLLQNLASVHGIELVIAVPHNIIGPRQKYDDPFRNVASIMINLMLQNRQPYIYGDGNQVRCFSSIDDDIDCLFAFSQHRAANGQIFNIGPDEEPITVLQLAEEIASIIGFDLDPVFLPGRPQEVKLATCSADKIRNFFNYETKKTTRETLTEMVSYISERGPRKFEYHLPLEIVNDLTPRSWTERLF